MEEPSIDECFRLLRLRRGADFATVKQVYRQTLYKCHPDRFQGRPDLLPEAERKTKRLIQIFGVLERWYEENGGTDIASAPGEPAPEPGVYAEDPPGGGDGLPGFFRRYRTWMGFAAVLAVAAAFARSYISEPPAIAEPPRAPIAPARGDAAPHPAALRPAADLAKAALTGLLAERDNAKALWVAAYIKDAQAKQQAARAELAGALVQVDRDVRDKSVEIKDAEDEMARQLDGARKESMKARDAFAAQGQAALAKLKSDFDSWLLASGEEAVAKVRNLRKRETSDSGVFSDTEDPRRILEFWTPGEAGSPEINIAAKTGVTVLLPDGRFFPHFRSNIFLYNPEGQALVHMMESVVEKHDALERELDSMRVDDDEAIANWSTLHPAGPAQLSAVQNSVMDARSRAIERLAAARVRVAGADLAANPLGANGAFDQSPAGKQWAERILALQKKLALAQGTP
jgi:hypothetical protein